jgi:hypothetical protein
MAKKKRYYNSRGRRSSEEYMSEYDGAEGRGQRFSPEPTPRYSREYEGRETALHRFGDDFYAGIKGRTKQENQDFMMLHEDHNAIANLPQNVMMKPYPRVRFAMDDDLNDDIRIVDYQMNADSRLQKKGPFPEKY